jgi:hypothetical protein
MHARILTVRRDELRDLLRSPGFVGLPREEAERLHGALELHALEESDARVATTHARLVTFTAIHYNYAWFSYEQRTSGDAEAGFGVRWLGLCDVLAASDDLPLFLDERIQAAAQATLLRRVHIDGGSHVRLAGVLPVGLDADACLALVYVARLRQPGVEPQDPSLHAVRWFGHEDLRQQRAAFEARSQALIDHLHAL